VSSVPHGEDRPRDGKGSDSRSGGRDGFRDGQRSPYRGNREGRAGIDRRGGEAERRERAEGYQPGRRGGYRGRTPGPARDDRGDSGLRGGGAAGRREARGGEGSTGYRKPGRFSDRERPDRGDRREGGYRDREVGQRDRRDGDRRGRDGEYRERREGGYRADRERREGGYRGDRERREGGYRGDRERREGGYRADRERREAGYRGERRIAGYRGREEAQRGPRDGGGPRPRGERADRVQRADRRRDERADRLREEGVESAPALPEDIVATDLDQEVRAELVSLARPVADTVARHLVATGRLIDEDPETALAHALAARRLAARIAAVREAVGLAAYHAGDWQTAIAELRTYHRLTGRQTHLAVLADAERALGRPERAIDLYRNADRKSLDPAAAVELLIVAAGARRDLGQDDAAVAMLQVRELSSDADEPWVPRLRYAYADALFNAGRRDEAREWFARAAEADVDAQTDAAERLLELDGVVLTDNDLDDVRLASDGNLGEANADDEQVAGDQADDEAYDVSAETAGEGPESDGRGPAS
jgi:tetratricopeptide (TPR) repeat protein